MCSNLHYNTPYSGCGKSPTDYDWSSSNPAVATVAIDGVVQTKGLGRTVIRATALGDVLNDDEVCTYQVLSILYLEYLSFVYCVVNLLMATGGAFSVLFLLKGELLKRRIVFACFRVLKSHD